MFLRNKNKKGCDKEKVKLVGLRFEVRVEWTYLNNEYKANLSQKCSVFTFQFHSWIAYFSLENISNIESERVFENHSGFYKERKNT